MTEEICICGHEDSDHYLFAQTDEYCTICYRMYGEEKCWHVFKLDNLTYIEKLAKERNLV